jgi:HSP20 family molecular chaperone IbpA
VLPDSAKANYKNGVLEVVMRRPAPKKKGKRVRVE